MSKFYKGVDEVVKTMEAVSAVLILASFGINRYLKRQAKKQT